MINIVYHVFIIIIILSSYPINFFFLFHWDAKSGALLVCSDRAGMLYQCQKEKGFFFTCLDILQVPALTRRAARHTSIT